MTLPPATAIAPWVGYEHLPIEDQPLLGVNGITDEQRLWLHFHLECAMRKIYHHHKLQTLQHGDSFLSEEFSRLDHISAIDH